MKKLMFALACAASAAVMGTDTLNNKATFEAEAFVAGTTTAKTLVGMTDEGAVEGDDMFWAFKGNSSDNDTSVVTAHTAAPDNGGSKYLKLETNGDELQRRVAVNEGEAVPTAVGDGLYIDTLVQFTATPDSSSVSIDAGAKLAIWLEGEDTYTLKVRGMSVKVDGSSYSWTTNDFALTFGEKSIEPDTWYRLVVRASSDAFPGYGENVEGNPSFKVNGFQVIIDGTVATVTGALEEDTLDVLEDVNPDYNYNQWIPSIDYTGEFKLTFVGFQGSGAIDNVEITDEDPFGTTSAEFTLTINFGDGVSAVTYTVGGETTDVTTSGMIVTLPQDTAVSIAAKTVADWFVAPAATEVTMTEDKTVTVTATAVTSTTIPETATGATLGITADAFASAGATALAPLVAWAQDKKVSIANINKMTFDANGNPSGEGDALTLAEAFLLNCASGEVNAEKDAFKLTITFDKNGAPVVSGPDGKTYNGQIKVKGKASLSDADWETKDDTKHKFFKAFLTK